VCCLPIKLLKEYPKVMKILDAPDTTVKLPKNMNNPTINSVSEADLYVNLKRNTRI
jgi:hypothetical protein